MFGSPIAGFFSMDVIVSFGFMVFVFSEGRRLGMNLWVTYCPICVGVSLALPYFIYAWRKVTSRG
jgi:hypothetical protein